MAKNTGMDLARYYVVVVYLRVSKDDKGTFKSVNDQLKDIEWWLKELLPNHKVHVVLCDDDKSADEGKPRPDWDKLRALVQTGKVDLVVVWEVSRLSRYMETGLEFIRECRKGKVQAILSADDEKVYELENSSDRSDLRKKFDRAEDELDQIKKRGQRGLNASRREGRQVGHWAYGYAREFDLKTKAPYYVVVEAEAAVVREIITYVADGGSTANMARKLNKRGVPVPNPGRNQRGWAPSTVLSIATNPCYIQKITAVPAVRYAKPKPGEPKKQHVATLYRDLNPDNLLEALQYERIIDDQTFFRAAANLQAKERKAFNPAVEVERGKPRHLLTHIAVCECGGSMTPGSKQYRSAVSQGANAGIKGRKGFQKLPEDAVRRKRVVPTYRCGKKFDVSVPEAAADDYVAALVIDKLAELAASLWDVQHNPDELVRARSELAEREKTLAKHQADLDAELVKANGGSDTYKNSLRNAIEAIETEITRLKADVERYSLPDALRPFAHCNGDREAIADVWNDPTLTLDAKRSVLRTLAEKVSGTRESDGARLIVVKRAEHAGRGQDVASRIEVTWKPIYVRDADQATGADAGEATT